MRGDKKDLESTVRRLRKDIADVQEGSRRLKGNDLKTRWETAVDTFDESGQHPPGRADYPRLERLFEIVRADGKIKLMMSYDQFNPEPDFRNLAERRQLEALLKFEEPLSQLIVEAGNLWRAGDYEGEASLLEEYAISNPQKDAILDLAAEARHDSISGAVARSKPKRR